MSANKKDFRLFTLQVLKKSSSFPSCFHRELCTGAEVKCKTHQHKFDFEIEVTSTIKFGLYFSHQFLQARIQVCL